MTPTLPEALARVERHAQTLTDSLAVLVRMYAADPSGGYEQQHTERKLLVESLATVIAEAHRAHRLREALKKLCNEVSGLQGLLALRELVGNTNVAVLDLRVAEARAALLETP